MRDNACGVVACGRFGVQESEADGLQPSTSRTPTVSARRHQLAAFGTGDFFGLLQACTASTKHSFTVTLARVSLEPGLCYSRPGT